MPDTQSGGDSAVSARFSFRSIFCEMATGDISRFAQISHLLFCKIIVVAKIPGVVKIFENLWYILSLFLVQDPQIWEFVLLCFLSLI